MKIGGLGEREVIREIMKFGKVSQKPDDCSILDSGRNYLLLTTDSITPETHIPALASAKEAGEFFASINLSDIAAMGGIPKIFMASFNLEKNMEIEYIEDFVKGIFRVLERNNVEYSGGDTKESKGTVFTGFCLGVQKKRLTRKRSQIAPNQIVCVTGKLGRVGAAYGAYINGVNLRENSKRILDISPKIREGQIISENGGKFMMDISDGLFGSIWQMKNDYGVGFRLSESDIKVDESVHNISRITGISERELAFNYGGDYELLFTIKNDEFGKFSKKMEEEGIEVCYIGDTWNGDNMIFNGQNWEKINYRGWEHLTK